MQFVCKLVISINIALYLSPTTPKLHVHIHVHVHVCMYVCMYVSYLSNTSSCGDNTNIQVGPTPAISFILPPDTTWYISTP